MSISRRGFVKILGSSAVILAAGAGGFALTREPKSALAPWAEAGNAQGDVRHKSISWAILSPNPHNRQPWIVDLSKTGEAVLYCDLDRRLPETDPFDRQITIGLGCFLEILRMAAAHYGYEALITPFPEGSPSPRLDKRPVAHIAFERRNDLAKDPLFLQVPDRRSTKEPFDTAREVGTDALQALSGASGKGAAVTADRSTVDTLRGLTWNAFEIEVKTPRTYMESVDLMRIGKAQIEANPDGIDLGGPMLETLNRVGILTHETLADMTSSAYQQGLDMYRPILETSMAFLWIVSADDSRIEQLNAGAHYVRANLKATEMGLAMHPVSQALQEYPEMSETYDQLHETLKISAPSRIQMLARLGYGPEVAASPRWPAASRIRNA